jgi:hypothetical protein
MGEGERPVRTTTAIAAALLSVVGLLSAQEGAPQPTREVAQVSDARMLIEGDILQIGFYRVGKAPYPEDIVPGAVLRALAQHLGLDLQTQGVFWGDYCFFAGVTGEAFRFLEFMGLGRGAPGKSIAERYGNTSTAELYRNALDAAGLAFVMHARPLDREAVQHQVVESLRDRRTPVIGLGGFGPPEPFLITGYDEGGDVLLGWSHLQGDAKDKPEVGFEPTGQFRLRDWDRVIDGVVVVTGKKDRPPLRQVYRDALARGVRELQTMGGEEDRLGMAAMEQWAVHLGREADYAGFSAEQWQKAHSDHGSTAGDLAERRALAASFVELAARVLPEARGDLDLAQAAFMGSHDTVYEIWETVARIGPFDPDQAKFRDPAPRATLAALVRRLIDLDRRGVRILQRVLRTAAGGDPGPAIPADPLLDGTVRLTKADAPAPPEPPLWAPENIAIANAMGMLRAFLGQPFGELNDDETAHRKLDYELWLGFSGAAFGSAGDGPERANLPLVFDALGYDYELWLSGKLAQETGLAGRVWGWDDNLRRRIFWNLRDRGLPVLLFNCGPWPDWWLVTRAENWGCLRGYGGSAGEGYRPNEPLDHPKNPLRPIQLFDWMRGKETWTVNLIAKRATPRPPLEELYRRAIEWGAQKLARPRLELLNADGTTFASTRPYEDWARMMRTTRLFPADDPALLKKRRDLLVGYEVELAERRFYGASFLDLAAVRLDRPELQEAAKHFRAVHRLMEEIWAQTGGMETPEGHLKYADPAVREAIAARLLEIGQEESAAAARLAP